MKTLITAGVAVATLLVGSAATVAAPTDATQIASAAPAKWVPRKLKFIYQGFTSKYSCDGLQDQMKQILQQLGAGTDLVVKRYGCIRGEGPEPTPGVYATFSVLQTAGEDGGAASKDDHGAAATKDVAARWDTVTINSDTPHQSNSGDCELIEQVKRQVLPLFTTRNLTFKSGCFPHDVSLAGARLSVEVLRPVKPAAAGSTPP